jgi:hypothetical protein
VTGVAFSADGRRIATASRDQTIRVWDAARGQQLHSLKGHTDPVTNVAFSSDGQRVFARNRNNQILAWDVITGRRLPDPPATLPGANLTATSPDRRLRAVGDGSTVQVQTLSPDGLPVDDARLPPPGFYDIDPEFHLRLANEAEASSDPLAAAFHVGWLLRHQPHSAVLHIRQAHLLTALGRREQAVTHLMHALFLHPRVKLVPLDSEGVSGEGRAP